MRKLKLLVAALALLVCAGLQAQKDVTSQYITNATLSNGTTGWTNVNFNAPVQGNNTVGWASECYAGWGSLEKDNYSLTQKITLPAGHYTLVNYSFFRYGLNADTDASKSLAFLKAGNDQVAVKTLGSIIAAGYANSQAEGANAFDSKMYRNALDFTIAADNTEIEIGLYGTFDLKQSWMICGMFELINNDIAATMDHPFDVTGYITNPGFEYRDMSGWTVTGGLHTQNNSQGFKVGGYYAQNWQSSASGALPAASMSQTLTNLPAGYYKLTANLGGNGTYLDLNGKTANWEADKDYTVGYVLAENEDLTITAGKTAEGTANWIHFDNFRLHFCGDVAAALTTLCAKVTDYQAILPANAYQALAAQVAQYNKTYSDVDELLAAIDAVQALYDAADLYIAYAAALADAQAIDQTAPMNADVLSALQTAIATEVTMQSTAAEAVGATNALKTATANATTSIANYIEAKTILDAANSYDATGQASYAANETIAAIQEAYDNRTLTAVSNEQKSAAAAALTAACKAQTQPTDGCDMTAYIVNPGIDGNSNGWTCNKLGNTNNTGGPMKPSNDALEYWGYSATNADAANRKFDYYQVISDLPNGVYTISADLWNSTNGEEGANWNGGGNAGLYGKTESAEVIALVTTDADTFSPYTTDQIFVYNGTLTIGVKNIKVLTGRWFVADNFKLTYVRQLTTEDKNTITSAVLKGSFDSWGDGLELVKVGETNSYSCELDIEDFVDVEFKPVINGNYMAYDKFTFDAPDGWIENAGGSDNNIKLNNKAALYKTYTVTATWTPQLDVTAGWTLKIEGKDERTKNTYTVNFVKGWSDWSTVYAYAWNDNGPVTAAWPGEEMTASTDTKYGYTVYTLSFDSYTAPTKVQFNVGNDSHKIDNLDFTDGMTYEGVTFEDFTVTDAGWATAKTTNNVTFTDVEGLKAYIATLSGTTVTLTEATTVPANTPIVLKGVTGKAAIVESAPAVTDNALTWYDNYTVNDSHAHIYALTIDKNDGKAKFARVKDGVTFSNKAVIELIGATARESLDVVFAGEEATTGISETRVNSEKSNAEYYNLNGQRVIAPAKGLYIVNGKKVILK